MLSLFVRSMLCIMFKVENTTKVTLNMLPLLSMVCVRMTNRSLGYKTSHDPSFQGKLSYMTN